MPEEDLFRLLSPTLKVTIYGDFVVVVIYPEKPPSDPFMLGWRGASYPESYEHMVATRDLQEEMAIRDMKSRKTKTGYYFDVVDVSFREEIEYEY